MKSKSNEAKTRIEIEKSQVQNPNEKTRERVNGETDKLWRTAAED